MVLLLDNVTIGYRHQPPLCCRIMAQAVSGESIALIGSNGAGKSTLLRSIAALAKFPEGRITLDGESIDTMRAEERARKIAYVSTEIISAAYVTVGQVVEMGRVPYSGWAGRLSESDRQVVERAMNVTQISEFAARSIDTLSDGQRQRVMIARALAQTTPVLILDEPTAFLDPENRELVIGLLGRLAREMRKIVIYSTHEVELARRHSHRVWRMHDRTLSTEN